MGAKCCGLRRENSYFNGKENADSASSGSDDDCVVMPAKTSIMHQKPDVTELQKSDIYSLVARSSGTWSNTRCVKHWNPTVPSILAKRELGATKPQQFTHGDMCYFNSRYLPNHSTEVDSYNSKAFCGTYSQDGNIFLSACQDQHIRVYNTSDDRLKLTKCLRAQDVGWSVLDTAFSPDGCYIAYSSWSDSVHLCSVYGDNDIHEALQFEPGYHGFCIFSLMFSSDNKEILGSANDGCLYVYDRESNKRTLKIYAHDDDVNTVRYADDSSQILYSGGDDGLCKVWDRRTLREHEPLPVGTLSGHIDGITYIDSKGDARFFISNSKDQSIKLWDIRHFSDQRGIEETKKAVASQNWDYRWQQVPKKMTKQRDLRGDSSLMTYRGHCIRNTLIRCKFSPESSTGQRYIYTGCASGSVFVYDVLTGKVESRLKGHRSCVRDVSWHPYKNIIISTSWDCRLRQWTYLGSDDDGEQAQRKEATKVNKQRKCKYRSTD
ncbi:hypothetical protein BsWGS_16440 [Bradybaena similaris]